MTVRYADVPADWADGFRTDTFTYRIRGRGGAAPREWTGTRRWKDVEVDAARDSDKFLALEDVRARPDVSLLSSEAARELVLVNPFAFP